jgi:hypothetical protein
VIDERWRRELAEWNRTKRERYRIYPRTGASAATGG